MEPVTFQEQGKENAWDTLRIRHLPSHLTHLQRERLLKRYGAVTVKTVHKSDKYAITFAKYPSEDAATRAFLQLHQLRVRGRRLSVDYAKMSPSQVSECDSNQPENQKEAYGDQGPVGPSFRTFLKKLNGWALGPVLTQPPPPNILYKYSPPTTDTLSRIAIQMLKEPVFYCQVLHLMNRMNLPPPFKELEAEFPFLRDIYNVERYNHVLGQAVARNAETGELNYRQSELTKQLIGALERIVTDRLLSIDCRAHFILHDFINRHNLLLRLDEKCLDGNEETESEMESDEGDLRPKEIIPVKRKLPQSKKRLKIPKFVNPLKQAVNTGSTSQKLVKPEDVFESSHRGESKSLRIELKVDSDLEKRLEAVGGIDPSASAPQDDGGFGLIYPIGRPEDCGAKNDERMSHESSEFVTSEQLAANRVSLGGQYYSTLYHL